MYKTPEQIHAELSAFADPAYKNFQAKLIPTVEKDAILGVRTPVLRRYAKELFRDTDSCEAFLADLPHRTYDENNLHAALLQQIRDSEECLCKIEKFLPYIDNWATCDSFTPKSYRHAPDTVRERCFDWLHSSHTYTVRYGIVILMNLFLDENFEPSVLRDVASVRSDEYYVQMAQAWFFSFALIKQYDAALPYLTEEKLSPWVHNKTIQKAIESFRISKEQKDYLRTLRRRG